MTRQAISPLFAIKIFSIGGLKDEAVLLLVLGLVSGGNFFRESLLAAILAIPIAITILPLLL
jgi:hypothetical protein